MGKGLEDLLKFTARVPIRDRNGKIKDTVWMRVIGDEDMGKVYRNSRIASSGTRNALRDSNSEEFKDTLGPIAENGRDELLEMILQSKETEFTGESYVKVDKDELPTIEEVAKEPDAPTLPEQERLDQKIQENREDYERRLKEYVQDRMIAFKAEMESKTHDELVEMARESLIDVIPLQTFVTELAAQKVLFATFDDEELTKKSFKTVEQVKNLHPYVKAQLVDAYSKLEVSNEDIKNL